MIIRRNKFLNFLNMMFNKTCSLPQCWVSPAGSNQWLAAERSSFSSRTSVLGPSSFRVKTWTQREQFSKSRGWVWKKVNGGKKMINKCNALIIRFFLTHYHMPNISQNHRFDMFLQEFIIKLCPSVTSINHAVAIQESQNAGPYIRLCSCAETWTRIETV